VTPLHDELTSVYVYLDVRGVVLYIGITGLGRRRQAQHADESEWWKYVARQEVEHHENRQSALIREAWLIRHKRPPFNNAQNPEHEQLRRAYLLLFDPAALAEPRPRRKPRRSREPIAVAPPAPHARPVVNEFASKRRQWVAARMQPGDELGTSLTLNQINQMGAEMFSCDTRTIRRDRASIRTGQGAKTWPASTPPGS
jgi:hypothetical protein